MTTDAPRCSRACGRTTGHNENRIWFAGYVTCAENYRHQLPGNRTCHHCGNTAGLLAPVHGTRTGERLGWLCTGTNTDTCGTVYGLDGEEITYRRVWNVMATEPTENEARTHSLGHPHHAAAYSAAMCARAKLPTGTKLLINEIFAEGPLIGQTVNITHV